MHSKNFIINLEKILQRDRLCILSKSQIA